MATPKYPFRTKAEYAAMDRARAPASHTGIFAVEFLGALLLLMGLSGGVGIEIGYLYHSQITAMLDHML